MEEKTFFITGSTKGQIEADTSSMKLSKEEHEALDTFLSHGSLDKLSATQKTLLKDVRGMVHGGDPSVAFFMRFDVSIVRID